MSSHVADEKAWEQIDWCMEEGDVATGGGKSRDGLAKGGAGSGQL